ncbi:MAG: BLUF domain-containing protein [bacterium]|nr:BLUF domain-containing protein [bacterium]
MKRITYISNFSRPLSSDEVNQIGEVSVRNNSRDQLTGALFCFRNIFYQILEGEEDAVAACFERISQDDRHDRVFILKVEQDIEAREYPDWSMKTVLLDENSDTLVRPIKNMLDSLSKTHRIMEKYTSEFVRSTIENGENPLLAPSRKKEAVVMFADIVGSTTLAELLPVEKVTAMLDAFYDASISSISAQGGDVLKLTGDGFMARFAGDQSQAAVEAAVALQKHLQTIRLNSPEDSPLKYLHAGVGITRGTVLEGNIGSGSRRDYTLLGDVVNTAARLEGVTRRVERGLIFDDGIFEALSNRDRVRKVGLYRPKGKTVHLNIYTIDDPSMSLTMNGNLLREKLQENLAVATS